MGPSDGSSAAGAPPATGRHWSGFPDQPHRWTWRRIAEEGCGREVTLPLPVHVEAPPQSRTMRLLRRGSPPCRACCFSGDHKVKNTIVRWRGLFQSLVTIVASVPRIRIQLSGWPGRSRLPGWRSLPMKETRPRVETGSVESKVGDKSQVVVSEASLLGRHGDDGETHRVFVSQG
jgi:hypothetical protein